MVGIRIETQRGAAVAKGDSLATILYGPDGQPSTEVIERLANAFDLGDDPTEHKPLIIERIG